MNDNEKKSETTDDDLPPVPAKEAGPDEWRTYYKALYEAGKLKIPEPTKN